MAKGRGWRKPDERVMVRWARERGWTLQGRNRQGHLVLLYPKNGATIPMSSSAEGRAKQNLEAQLARFEACTAETLPIRGVGR